MYSSMSLFQKISIGFSLFFLACIILRAFYQAYKPTVRDIPGPWLAKYTRLWQLYAVYSRKFEKINVQLHRKYGNT